MKCWLLLAYRIPREPTAGRVYIWRKLKKLGAIAVQDAVWVLPKSSRTAEQFQWLATEISELNGEAFVWDAEQIYATNADSLREQFVKPIELEYREILEGLQKKNADLASLAERFRQTKSRDYFSIELGEQVRKRLLSEGKRKST